MMTSSTSHTTTRPSAASRMRRVPDEGPARARLPQVSALVAWMTVAIAAVAALAYYDEQREARAALDDFADDQAWLADALSRALGERLLRTEREVRDAGTGLERGVVEIDGARVVAGSSSSAAEPDSFAFELRRGTAGAVRAHVAIRPLLSSVSSFERPGDVRVFVQPAGRSDLIGADGSPLKVDAITRALQSGVRSATIDRGSAATLGLPPRMAMAGLAGVDGGALGRWNVAVVATAQVERDREGRARARLLLAVTVAIALVLTFGGLAVRIRMKELELRHALTLGVLETERDEKLGHADQLATLGALAIGIAHEVSTPLGVILARAEQVARRCKDDERSRHAAESIVNETERINEVIRGFLRLVRGHGARLENASPVDVAKSAVGLVSHRFAKAGVTLETNFGDAPVIACDRRLFEQVLANLLLNACEACDESGVVALTVRGDVERVAFIVADNGHGLPPEAGDRFLEPFFTTKSDGTGFGLAIVAEIVKHHGGALAIKSRDDGPGTLAVVELHTAPTESIRDD